MNNRERTLAVMSREAAALDRMHGAAIDLAAVQNWVKVGRRVLPDLANSLNR